MRTTEVGNSFNFMSNGKAVATGVPVGLSREKQDNDPPGRQVFGGEVLS